MSERAFTIVIICIYFATLVGLGLWNMRKIKNTSDYILAGGNLKFWAFVLLLTGSAASGMTILGVSGLGFFAGWPSFWEQFCVPLSCSFCLIFFGAKLSQISQTQKYMTIEDYLCHRYESQRSMRLLSSVAVALVSLVYLTGQFKAVGIILSWLLDISHQNALIIGALITMSYVLLGGLRAIASIASLQVMIMLIGVGILCPLIIAKAGDFNSTLAAVDTNMLKAFYPQAHPPVAKYAFFTPLFTCSFVLFLIMGLGSAPHIINNVLAVNKRKYFKWAPLVIFLVYFAMMALIKISGFAARSLAENGLITVSHPDDCFIKSVELILIKYKYLSVLAGAVVLAAVMTTTDRLMLTIGNCISWDIYKKYVHKNASDSVVNTINRLTVFATTVIAVSAALMEIKLLAFLIWAAIGVMFSTFTIPLLGGLYWKRATKPAAITAMLIGFAAAILFACYHKFVHPLPMHFSIYSFGTCLLVYVIVSLFTRPVSAETLDETQTGFYIRIFYP